jgi:ABC-type transporter Mla subunit MlaD
MAKSDTEAIAVQLGAISESIENVKALGKQTEALANDLREHGRISQEQLDVFRFATESTQQSLVSLLQMGNKFDALIDSGGQAMDHMEVASQRLSELTEYIAEMVSKFTIEIDAFSKSAAGSLESTVAALLTDFKESINRMQDSLAVSKSLLVESVAGVTPALRAFVEPTISELRQSSLEFVVSAETLRTTLDGIPELVANRIENLAQPSVITMSLAINSAIERLATVFEPATNHFVEVLQSAQGSVQATSDSVTTEMKRMVADSVAGFETVSTSHRSTVQRSEAVVDRMESLLDNSKEFSELVSSVERNLALTIEIDKLLLSKKQPLYSRLAVAIVGAICGFLVSRAVLNVKDELIVVVLLPAFIATLNGDAWVTSILKHLDLGKKKS